MTRPQAASDEGRHDKRSELLARLGDQAEQLADSDGWKEWLSMAGRFRSYSLNNQLLIWAQRPDATRVAGFRNWQALGRQVRKGEKGIAIMAPMVKVTEDQGDKSRVLFGFKVVHVFDVAQTEGDELNDLVLPEVTVPNDDLRDLLLGCVTAAGLHVELVETGPSGVHGWWTAGTQTVTVVTSYSLADQCRTILHELGHANDEAHDDDTRATRELVAESAAYLVATAIGMEVDESSTTYVTSWGADKAQLLALSQRVLDVATKVETTIDHALTPT